MGDKRTDANLVQEQSLFPVHVSPYLLLVLTALFWSGNFVVGRALQGHVPPIALSFWRWAIALALLLPFAAPRMRSQWTEILKSWKALVLLGLLGVASFNTLAYIGLQSTTATNGVLLNSVIPVLIIGINRIFFGQRLQTIQMAGLILSLAGVLCIISRGDPYVLLQLHLNPGDLWVLAAVLVWAVYTVCLRWRPKELDALAFLGATMCVGVMAVAPLYIWEAMTGARINIRWETLAGFAYVGIFPSLLAYIFWNRAVREVGASIAGLFIHLMPVFGTVLSVIFLGEVFHLFHGAGIFLIFLGIYLTTRFRRA